jgi:hypothetical protein
MSFLLSQYILPPPVVPYFPVAFFGLCAAFSYILLVSACRIAFDFRAVISFAVFAAFPVWSCLLEFPTNTETAGMALVFCAAAIFLLGAVVKKTRRAMAWLVVAQVVAVTCAVGTYQAFILVYVAMALCVVYMAVPREGQIRSVLLVACVCLVSVALDLVVQQAFLAAMHSRLAYVDQFFRPDLLLASPVQVLRHFIANVAQTYMGSRLFFGVSLWAAPILVVLAILSVLEKRSALAALLFFGVLAVPFVLVVVAGQMMPMRTMLALPSALWLCSVLATSARQAFLRWVGIAATLLLGLQSAAAISQYQAERELAAKFDQRLASAIYERISQVADLRKPQLVELFGAVERKPIYRVPFGSSAGGTFFHWDGGNPNRMLAYMQVTGYQNLVLVPNQRRLQLKGQFAGMPSWPAPGSVRKVDDVVLVKLGDQPGYYAP